MSNELIPSEQTVAVVSGVATPEERDRQEVGINMDESELLDIFNDDEYEFERQYLTNLENAFAALIVEKCASRLTEEQRAELLFRVRKFAGIVGGRHYVLGNRDRKRHNGIL